MSCRRLEFQPDRREQSLEWWAATYEGQLFPARSRAARYRPRQKQEADAQPQERGNRARHNARGLGHGGKEL